MKKALILLLAIMMVITVVGCGGTYTDPPAPQNGGDAPNGEDSEDEPDTSVDEPMTFTIIADEPNTLNPILSVSSMDSEVFYLISAFLFRTYDGVTSPEVCDYFEVSEDHLTYTYYLKDAVYSDGTPITADDFAFYIISQLDPNFGSPNASDWINTYGIKNAREFNTGEVGRDELGVTVLDEKSFEITLENPVATFDGMLTIMPLREDFAVEKGEALGGSAQDIEFSGPYVLKDWVYEGYLLFEKNPLFIEAENSFPVDEIEVLVGVDHNTRVAMFENGEVDVVKTINREGANLLSEHVKNFPSGMQQAIQFNPYGKGGNEETGRIMANKNFRKALSYALNREAIVAAVNPLYDPTNRFISRIFLDENESQTFVESYPVESVPLDGDSEQAKAYLQTALEELGYDSVSELPELSYLTFDVQDYIIAAETFVNQWKQVLGIESIVINNQPVPLAIQAMMGYEYDIYYTSLSAGDDPSTILNFWITGGTVNDVVGSGRNLWSNEEYDQLLRESFLSFDLESRYELLAQAEQILLNEGPLEPFMAGNVTSAVQPWVEGYVYNSLDGAFSFNQLRIQK